MRLPVSLAPAARQFALVWILLGLAACASKPAGYSDKDSLEPVNRAVYGFNSFVDKVMLRPLALGYKEFTPAPAQTGISNVFANLLEPANSINNLLQGKPRMSVNSAGRFVINSTLGVAGIFDVAGNANFVRQTATRGLRSQEEDFGQTLAKWGVPAGPYLVLPFLGPSTLRDAISLGIDTQVNPMFYTENRSVGDKLLAVRLLELRASLLPLDDTVNRAQDPYAFVRSAYRQNREFLIWDGNPPLDQDLYDEQY
jgi:phospholipid-binding lipoprotein MlaA